MAFGAEIWSVGHLRGGFFHPRTGKAVGTLPARLLFFPCRLLAPGGRLMARHPGSRSATGQTSFEAPDVRRRGLAGYAPRDIAASAS